jgi:tetratricopeptide (TPR) repeat protein
MRARNFYSSLFGAILAIFCFTVSAAAQSSSQSPRQSQTSPPPPAATPESKSAQAMELVKQGQRLSERGGFDEAITLYERALQLDPGLYDAEVYMGVALDLQGKYEEARRHLAKAISLANEQQTIQALRVMAISYAFEKNTDKASEYERRAFDFQYNWKKYSDAANTADELARIYLESGDLDNAFQWYQTGHLTALKNPDITQAEKDLWEFRWEAALARIASRRGQTEQAKQHLAAAKAILDKNANPGQLQLYPYLVGYVALDAGDYKTAIAELQKVPFQDPFTFSLLAQAYEKSGDRAQAVEYYRKVFTVNVHNPASAFSRPLARKKLAVLVPATAAQ